VVRIDKISVENFRLFEKQEFSFHPQFNLIVGVNGSGKSSLLKALAICISGQVLELGGDKEELCLVGDEDELQVIVGDEDLRYEKAGRTNVNGYFSFVRNDSAVLKHAVVSSHYGYLTTQYREETEVGFDWPTRLDFSAPLYSFYGCNRLWQNKKDKQVFENAMQAKYSRRDGYNDWLQAQADDIQLIEWLLKQNIIAFQEGKESLGWRVLNKALKNCFEGFEKLSFMAKEGDLVVHDIDDKGNPRRKLFKHMSDGQRCMIGLVGDMVRRAVLLNPQLGDEILEKTAGVVLIDELDLHLHPTWQRRIIDDLRKTFPKVQFICTTHSPQLIGQAKADEVILLGSPFPHPPQSYGMVSKSN
jgi:predicted ATP-binding protein involved in virulence